MFSCSTERHWKTFLLPFFGMSRWNISSFSLLWGRSQEGICPFTVPALSARSEKR